MTFEGIGTEKAQHGIDDIVSSYATVGGRIREATGEYEDCEGAISMTAWFDHGELDDDNDISLSTSDETWAVSIIYEWP